MRAHIQEYRARLSLSHPSPNNTALALALTTFYEYFRANDIILYIVDGYIYNIDVYI